MPGKKIFKKCPMCSAEWESRDSFLNDNSLEINGYGANFKSLENSLFYFTHRIDGCLSTMAIKAKDFFDLYSGEKYLKRKTGKDTCPGYCLDKKQLDRCDAFCECAFNREIIQMIKNKHRH